jgi:hypothetical protein
MEDAEEIDEPKENDPPVVIVKPIQTLRTKLIGRAERRKKSGLVQERIISVSHSQSVNQPYLMFYSISL